MLTKLVASITILAGATAVIFSLATAFGLNFNVDQRSAIEGVIGLVVALAGVWLHPSLPSPGSSVPPGT